MKQYITQYDTKSYELEESDFDYLDAFIATKSSLGIDLECKSNKLLSIHIGKYSIKYDYDISSRGLFLAKERIDIKLPNILDYKDYMPTSCEELAALISEFKFRGLGNVSAEEIKNFLNHQ